MVEGGRLNVVDRRISWRTDQAKVQNSPRPRKIIGKVAKCPAGRRLLAGQRRGAYLRRSRLHQFSYDGASNWHKPLQMEIPAVDPALPHKMQLKHFVKVVRREVEPVVTPADNVKTLTLLNAIKEAAETGQLVEL